MLNGTLQWSVYPQQTRSIYSHKQQPLQISLDIYAGTHFTDPGRMESWVNFSRKEGHPNNLPLTRPGIELETSGLGGRDLNHCPNPSAKYVCMYNVHIQTHLLRKNILTNIFSCSFKMTSNNITMYNKLYKNMKHKNSKMNTTIKILKWTQP